MSGEACMHAIMERIKNLGVIPVVTIQRPDEATSVADALVEGGLACAEITLRTEAAVDAIRLLSRRGDLLVGAGTVLTITQVNAARDAGADFMVSPGFNPKVAGYCIENKILHIPGICTPSEIEAALDLGLRVLKFFPAEALGGLKTLAAMSKPYADVEFIPTGGINPQNLAEYLCFSGVSACGGTWIAESRLISGGRFDDILMNTRQAVDIARACRRQSPIP